MAHYRTYSVRAGMSGRMTVDVPLGAIKLRGEHKAVLEYAFAKLMGEDNIIGAIEKNSPTRKFLIDEMFSRYSHQRGDVFDTFCAKVRYEPMRNILK